MQFGKFAACAAKPTGRSIFSISVVNDRNQNGAGKTWLAKNKFNLPKVSSSHVK
ncbi:MAG: hypothetical protein WAL66_06405 [Nitrososphaeraceae archaeon]